MPRLINKTELGKRLKPSVNEMNFLNVHIKKTTT